MTKIYKNTQCKNGEIPENILKIILMKLQLKQVIDPDLKKLLMDYTNDTDIVSVCADTKVGFHSVKHLKQGSRPIVDDNQLKAMQELAKKAFENIVKVRDKATKDKKNLSALIDCI
jgi:hypothetical protein